MVIEQLTLKKKDEAPAVPPSAEATTTDQQSIMQLAVTLTPMKRSYLTWEDDPVLAELWDNEEDAAAFHDEHA